MRSIVAVTFLSFQQKRDVFTVIQYPLGPGPPCFTHPDGALRYNPKSNVYKVLKGMVNTEAPQNSNTEIAVGMFLIQSSPHCLNYSIFVHIYTYIYTHTHTHIYIYIYILHNSKQVRKFSH